MCFNTNFRFTFSLPAQRDYHLARERSDASVTKGAIYYINNNNKRSHVGNERLFTPMHTEIENTSHLFSQEFHRVLAISLFTTFY